MKYYVAKKGLPIKGLTAGKVRELLLEGQLTGDDLVFSWKHDVWTTINELKLYQQHLQQVAEKRKLPGSKVIDENAVASAPRVGMPWAASCQDDSFIIDLKAIQDEKINKTYGFETIDLADDSGSWDELETYYLPLGADDSPSIHIALLPEDSPSEEWFQQTREADVPTTSHAYFEDEYSGSFHSGVISDESLSEEWLQAFKDANMPIDNSTSGQKPARFNFAIINCSLSLLIVFLVLILAGLLVTKRFH